MAEIPAVRNVQTLEMEHKEDSFHGGSPRSSSSCDPDAHSTDSPLNPRRLI